MKTFFVLIFISLTGIAIALGTVYYGDLKKSGDNVEIPSIELPYHAFIAGTGIIEAGSKNIVVGSNISGIIKKVTVRSGDQITKGSLLFEIDDRAKKATLPVLRAAIKSSSVKLQSAKHQLDIINKMKKLSSNMVTNEQYTKVLDHYHEAQYSLALSKQKLKALQNELKLYKVYAPIDGSILRSDITEGSYFSANTKALILGSNQYNIIVNINEFDSWKFEKDADAVAFVRGNPKQKVALKYLYTIPLVTPKKNLTGMATEQTDTRVLQAVYRVAKAPDFPIYVGEMLDVFIQTSRGQ